MLHLWQGYGIELEYMIVDRDSLAVRPISDQLLKDIVGEISSDYESGEAAWSNELVLHVIEFKTNGPAKALDELPALFQQQVSHANRVLAKHNAMLLGTGMHPFFDPATETKIWPHDYNIVYETYNRIFDCRGHGWSNLQSTHLNLPFADDVEFGRLHAAIRYILPILPALAASTPVADGKLAPALDFRLVNYAGNSARIPSATGEVIPEPIYDKDSYYKQILQKIWDDTAPFDPDGNLQGEFANARGAIARFDRMAIEIRLLDIQECPEADIAIVALITAALKALERETWRPMAELKQARTHELAQILRHVMVGGETTVIHDRHYLQGLGIDASSATAGEVWSHLLEAAMPPKDPARMRWGHALEVILKQGTLATRLRKALGDAPDRARMVGVYAQLAKSLQQGRLFEA